MSEIIIGFSTRKGIIPYLIRLMEGTKYSHVYLRRNSKNIGSYIYQASGLSVNFTGLDIFLKKNQIIQEYKFDLTRNQLNDILRFFIKNAGKPYSLKQLIILGIITFFNKLGINLKFNTINDNDAFICSELAGRILKDILQLKIDENMDFITPAKLQNLIFNYQKNILI